MIDTTTPNSAGWWMQQLANRLTHPRRQRRLAMLHSYYTGNPPLPIGAENARAAYQAFQRKSRSNFSALIVDAPISMLQVRAIRTAQANDDVGDQLAWSYWRRNQMAARIRDVWRMRGMFGESYMSVGMPADIGPFDSAESPVPVFCVEDPRQTYTLDDPTTGRASAALKLFSDPLQGLDFAYLWLPGEMYVATQPRQPFTRVGGPQFNAQFTLRDDLYASWDTPVVPIVKFRNRGCRGEFEGVTDILDRINHMLLMRMTIATYQAHRQRAIQVDPKDMPELDPETKQPIDYDDIFAADPGALWKLPLTAKMWESAQVDLTPMLGSVKDDVLHLAAITRTPLTMFTPDAATQTAEGAQLQREGLVFKVSDLQQMDSESIAELYALAFTFAGQPERARLDQITVDWRPAERYSLAERAAAGVQAAQAQVPWRTRMSEIFQFDPDEIDRMDAERMDDATFAAATGAQATNPVPQLPPVALTATRLARAEDVASEAVG